MAVHLDRLGACPVPPPAWGKQKRRGPGAACALENQAAGRALFAQSEGEELAFLWGQGLQHRPGRGHRNDRRLLLRAQQNLLEVAGVELARVVERGTARLMGDLLVVRAIGKQAR